MREGSSASPEARFERTAEFFGPEGFAAIRKASVAVFGLGGVGGHAAVCLARNGIGALHLIDFDLVSESSLNRSAYAGPSDVGARKAEVLRLYLQRTCPDTDVRISCEFADLESIPVLLEQDRGGWVVDAIDSLNPKVQLLQYCVSNGIPVVSSMGASCRIDPSAIRVDDISRTEACPLARKVRSYLRRRGVTTGIECVFSVEVPPVRPGPPDESEMIQRRGRIRNRLPGAGAIPGMFGCACAAVVLKGIAKAG